MNDLGTSGSHHRKAGIEDRPIKKRQEVIQENMGAIQDEIEAKVDTIISCTQECHGRYSRNYGDQGGHHHEHWPRSDVGLSRKDGGQTRDVG
jgi:hypothetical protein